MPVTLHPEVKRLHPELDVRIAFERTIVDVERVNARLVANEAERRDENDYVVMTEDEVQKLANDNQLIDRSLKSNALMLTKQRSFCDPINGFALYRIRTH